MSILNYTQSYLVWPAVIFVVLYFVQFSWMERGVRWFASFFQARGVFAVQSVSREASAINLVRILLGCLLFYRWVMIAVFQAPLDNSNTEWLALWLYPCLIALLIVGLLTPVISLLLLLYQLHFNFTLSTYTLGVDVTAMILVTFVLFPVGQKFSLDAWIAKRVNAVGRCYRWFSYSDPKVQIGFAKSISFCSYYLLCLYSVMLHLNEPLWLNGEAAIHLLSSSYLSRFSDFFQWLFSSSAVAVFFAEASMVVMVVWYFALLPFVLYGGWLRKFAIIWSVLFFLVSAFVLQLSILAYIEFLLLFIWFWSSLRNAPSRSVNMLYDDRCNLCDRTVRFIDAIDLFDVVSFTPLSRNAHFSEKLGVDLEGLRRDLYGWDSNSNEIHSGYNFYIFLSKRIFLLWPLYPLLLLGRLVKVGPFIYRVVADRRIQLFGVCKLPSNLSQSKALLGSVLDSSGNNSKRFFLPFACMCILYGLFFITIMPGMPTEKIVSKSLSNVVRSAHILSWSRINVFNRSDLSMSHHYFSVEYKTNDGFRLIPYGDSQGNRLEWHRSERVYFGNSLRWRRIKNAEQIFPPTASDIQKFCEIIVWSKKFLLDEASVFKLRFYKSGWPKKRDGIFEFPAPIEVATMNMSSDDCR